MELKLWSIAPEMKKLRLPNVRDSELFPWFAG